MNDNVLRHLLTLVYCTNEKPVQAQGFERFQNKRYWAVLCECNFHRVLNRFRTVPQSRPKSQEESFQASPPGVLTDCCLGWLLARGPVEVLA